MWTLRFPRVFVFIWTWCVMIIHVSYWHKWIIIYYLTSSVYVSPCLGGRGFNSRLSETKRFQIGSCIAPLSSVRYIKGSSTKWTGWPGARIMWPVEISYDCACGVISQWDSTLKWLSYPLLQAGTVLKCVEMLDVKPNIYIYYLIMLTGVLHVDRTW